MLQLKKAIPNNLISDLVQSTILGLENKDCYFDQFHYVNRHFVDKNLEFFTTLIAKALNPKHPGITSSDLTFVNDFVAPVNLENAQIHTGRKDNKYDWHIDGIDRVMGPCYNLWIPLYRKSALKKSDDQSLFDVMEKKNVPGLYTEKGEAKTYFFIDPLALSKEEFLLAQDYLNTSEKTLTESVVLYCLNGKSEVFPHDKFKLTSVTSPEIGDAYLFSSSEFHSSGPSEFERVGITLKFIVNNAEQGFKHISNENRMIRPLAGWDNLFLGCYFQFGELTSYQKYIDLCIGWEREQLESHEKEVNCVLSVLREIQQEI